MERPAPREDRLNLVVAPAWLARALGEPDLRIVDATWYLPDAGRDAQAEYAAGHVPGAVHLDVSRELADTRAPLRNTLATPKALGRAFARAGIGSGDRVVVYDRLGGYSAARVWWALRCVGHDAAALLDGGFERWCAEGHPVSRERPSPRPGAFHARPRPSCLATKADVLRIVREGGATLVDARSPERFRGEAPEHTLRRGHIPGARNVPWSANLVGDPPVLRSREALARLYAEAGVDPSLAVVTTCGSGITACLDAFVLTWLGHPRVAVYDGSWAEWGDAEDVPVEP